MNARTPNCPYCRLPLTANEFDFESNGFFSAHSACVGITPAGRFLAADGHRYSTAKRAIEVSQWLADANHRTSFLTFDVEAGAQIGKCTMGREERRRRMWYYSPDAAADAGMPRPVHAIAGTVFPD